MKHKSSKKSQPISAERILKWLTEANQFVQQFLSKKEQLKWKKIKNQAPK